MEEWSLLLFKDWDIVESVAKIAALVFNGLLILLEYFVFARNPLFWAKNTFQLINLLLLLTIHRHYQVNCFSHFFILFLEYINLNFINFLSIKQLKNIIKTYALPDLAQDIVNRTILHFQQMLYAFKLIK